jgi:hypothetical protein
MELDRIESDRAHIGLKRDLWAFGTESAQHGISMRGDAARRSSAAQDNRDQLATARVGDFDGMPHGQLDVALHAFMLASTTPRGLLGMHLALCGGVGLNTGGCDGCTESIESGLGRGT